MLRGIPRTDKLLLIGDFNARIGRENDKWPLVMGKQGIGKCNSNGELLLALCSEFELIVMNTMFKQKDERNTTWMHPRSRHWHMIDFITTRCRDKIDIHRTRVMRGANCWADHQMLRSKVDFRIRQSLCFDMHLCVICSADETSTIHELDQAYIGTGLSIYQLAHRLMQCDCACTER